MKNLQETLEQTWQFTSFAELRGVIKRPKEHHEVVLLLHGLGERGKRIYRKLLPYLPEKALVIAPNGPFPLPRQKENRVSYGHSWYFFDKSDQKYFINQDLAKFWLRDLLKIENPNGLPVTIIGFSQGGYLAPLVGMEIPETKLVMGLACEFRTTLIHKTPSFPLVGIHGELDEIVKIQWAREQIEKLKMDIPLHPLPHTGHEITTEMGQLVQRILEQYGKRSL